MGLGENPFELRQGRFVDLDRPDPFVGREALARIREEGPKRLLTGFVIEGEPLPDYTSGPWPVCDAAGETVGRITSAVWSPRLGRNLALGLVRTDLATPGTRLRLGLPDATPVVVHDLPFVPRGRPARTA